MALEEGLDKLIIVVTPLNLLKKQNVDALKAANLSAISITAENNIEKTYKVRTKSLALSFPMRTVWNMSTTVQWNVLA